MFEVVTRDMWGAETTFDDRVMERPATDVFFTLTDSCPCYGVEQCSRTLLALQKRYVYIKMLPDIPYNFMIGGDGRVYEGRGWGIAPDLPKRVRLFENVAFHLLFMLNNIGEAVPKAMIETKDEILTYGIKQNLMTRIPRLHKPIRQTMG